MQQRSDEWFDARLGKFTASRMGDLMARTKSGPAASHKTYIVEVAMERLTGERPDRYTNDAMQWGIDTEAEARDLYAFVQAVTVDEVGFIDHPTVPRSGASPDGLIGDDGMLEIKCPATKTHWEYLVSQKVPRGYLLQMQWQMACAGRQWCDWMSYDPRFTGGRIPPGKEALIIRVDRDPELIAEICETVEKADAEVERRIQELIES